MKSKVRFKDCEDVAKKLGETYGDNDAFTGVAVQHDDNIGFYVSFRYDPDYDLIDNFTMMRIAMFANPVPVMFREQRIVTAESKEASDEA